jgi:hypothetical protein
VERIGQEIQEKTIIFEHHFFTWRKVFIFGRTNKLVPSLRMQIMEQMEVLKV